MPEFSDTFSPRPPARLEVPRLILLVTLFLTGLATMSAFSFAQQPDNTPPPIDLETNGAAITVVGRGVAYGEPDVATLELGVSASDPDVRTALSTVDEGIAAVMETLAALGLPASDIRTTSFNIWREERFPQGEREESPVTVFRAQHMLTVEIEGSDRAGEVLAEAVEAGANMVGGISFSFSNPAELESRAREAAVADARQRAEQLAGAVGATLGAPVQIQELSGATPPDVYFERSAAIGGQSPIATGELSAVVQVAIRYRIEAP